MDVSSFINKIARGTADFLKEVNKDISAAAAAIINKMMAKTPDESKTTTKDTSNNNLKHFGGQTLRLIGTPISLRVVGFFSTACGAIAKELHAVGKNLGKPLSKTDSISNVDLLTNFNDEPPKASKFKDVNICGDGGIEGFERVKPMNQLNMQKLTQSLGRLSNRLNLTINGEQITTIDPKGPKDEAATKKVVTKGLQAAARMRGETLDSSSIDEKASGLSKFDNQDIENFRPYSDKGKLQVENQDIMVLALATKEFAGKAIGPIYLQIRNYGNIAKGLEGSNLGIAMIDQFDSVDITLGDNGNVKAKCVFENLTIKAEGEMQAKVQVTVEAEIDKATGKVGFTVQYGNLRFNDSADLTLRKHIMKALKTDIPGTEGNHLQKFFGIKS